MCTDRRWSAASSRTPRRGRPPKGRWAGLALAMALLAGGCDLLGPEGVDGPGSISVELLSPNGVEGAAVFEVTGGTGFGAVTAPEGKSFFDHGPESSRVVVVLDQPGEVRFEISTDNVAKVPTVEVVQVADGQNALRGSLDGYEVRTRKIKVGSQAWTGASS